MYSSAEINRISGSRLAVYNRKYTEDNGDIWIGTADNRLKRLYLKDVNVGVELYGSDPTQDLKTYLRNLETSIPSTKAVQVEINFGELLFPETLLIEITDTEIKNTSIITPSISISKDRDYDELEFNQFNTNTVLINEGQGYSVIVSDYNRQAEGKYLLNLIIEI